MLQIRNNSLDKINNNLLFTYFFIKLSRKLFDIEKTVYQDEFLFKQSLEYQKYCRQKFYFEYKCFKLF